MEASHETPKPAMSIFAKLAIGLIAILAAAFIYGETVGFTPNGKAEAQAKKSVQMCRDRERFSVEGPAATAIISDECKKLEDDFESTFGHAP